LTISGVFELSDVHYPRKSIILDIISGMLCELSISSVFELSDIHYPTTNTRLR
jgi:hypothetical protein